MRVLTLVVVGSSLDRRMVRLVTIPRYLPFSFRTARTGGIPFLKASKHLDSVSFSCTELYPFEKISLAVAEVVAINNPFSTLIRT